MVWAATKTLGGKGNCVLSGQYVGQVDRAAQVELAERTVGRRVDLPGQRAGLDLERTDIGRTVERQPALIDRDTGSP